MRRRPSWRGSAVETGDGPRLLLALTSAVALHLGLFFVVTHVDERRLFEPVEAHPIDFELIEVPPPAPDEPSSMEEELPRVPPPPDEDERPPVSPPPPAPAVAPAPPTPEETPPIEAEPPETGPRASSSPSPRAPGSDSPVRLPRSSSLLDRVLGGGRTPFGTGLGELEGALEYRADGPLSDKRRAELRTKRMIEDDLSEDAVSAGLADDYFRLLKTQLETAWQPAKKDLSDGGKSVEHLGFMRDSAGNAEAYGELWKAYLDLAQQYANGKQLVLEKGRVRRLREVMRSRKGNFRFHAIAEVVLTQASDGKVLTIEMPIESGHPRVDESIKDAFLKATATMPDPPPERLSHGRAFRSTWRMRATWTLVPPTALLTGASWDIGPNGLEMDVPFQIKLSTHILLLSFNNRDHAIREAR